MMLIIMMLIIMILIIVKLIIKHLFCQPWPELPSTPPTSPNSLWNEIVPLGTHLVIVILMVLMLSFYHSWIFLAFFKDSLKARRTYRATCFETVILSYPNFLEKHWSFFINNYENIPCDIFWGCQFIFPLFKKKIILNNENLSCHMFWGCHLIFPIFLKKTLKIFISNHENIPCDMFWGCEDPDGEKPSERNISN